MSETPSYRLKIDRAVASADALQKDIERWGKAHPYAASVENDPKTEKSVIRLQSLKPLPDIWPVMFGECLYNARSAMDHLIGALAVAHQGRPLPIEEARQIQFPITKSASDFASEGAKRLRLLSHSARDLVEQMQPHYGGASYQSEGLWLFNAFSNLDKHRSVAIIAHALVDPKLIAGPNAVITHFDAPSWVPLNNGTAAIEFQAGHAVLESKAHLYLDFSIDVLLHEPSIMPPGSVTATLWWFLNHINHKIIPALETFL